MKKAFSILIGLVMTVSLSFGTAFGVTANTQSEKSSDFSILRDSESRLTVFSKASKSVKVRVITRIGDDKFSYTSKGLIKRRSTDTEITSYKYKGKKLASFIEKSSITSVVTKANVTYKKSGRINKVTFKEMGSGKTYSDYYYYNSKGRVSKRMCVGDSFLAGTNRYYYDKKKRVYKIVGDDLTSRFAYDRRGYCNYSGIGPTSGYGMTREFGMKNVYKNGRIVKVGSATSGTGTIGYFWKNVKYKTIKAPKAFVTKIKQQQKALFNPDPKVIL